VIAIEANAFVAKRAAKTLQRLDDGTAVALRVELHSLPTLEAVSGHQAVKGLPSGYRSLTLPSGYLALYRRLTPVEIKDVTGDYSDQDAYLVADLVRLIPAPEPEEEATPI
jgi:hypothetical protein